MPCRAWGPTSSTSTWPTGAGRWPGCPQVLVGILALQGDVAEHSAVLRRLGAETRPVRRPDDLDGLDGIVLPGGESTTMSMLLESSGLLEPLAAALRGGLPAFGTCAGLILLATEVLDGRPDQRSLGMVDVAVRRNGYGRQLQSFECDLPVAGAGEPPVHAVFIRAPRIESTGPSVTVLARLPAGATAAPAGAAAVGRREAVGGTPVVCRQGAVLVAAFHPELTGDDRVHRLFVTMVGGGTVAEEEPPRLVAATGATSSPALAGAGGRDGSDGGS